MSGFNNSIVGGASSLIRKALQSPNFVAQSSGWQIAKDGSAQFNNVTMTGQLSVLDTNGNTLAGIDGSGNISGQTISAANDVLIGGSSVSQMLDAMDQGVLNVGWIPYQSSGGGYPNTPIAAGTNTGLLAVQAVLSPGRVYRVRVPSFRVIGGTVNGYVNGQLLGIAGSTITLSGATTYANQYVVFDTNASDERTMPDLEAIFTTTDGGPTVYTFLLALSPGSSTVQIRNPNSSSRGCAYLYVEDIGDATGIGDYSGGNNGNVIAITGGSSGGSTVTQTYTFYGASGYSYYGSGSLRQQNSSLYQGESSGNPGGDGSQYSYIDFSAVGSTIPSGATINWVKFRLNCLHSWYNSGMTVGLWTAQGLNNGTRRSSVSDQWSIGEGQLLQHTTVKQVALDLMGSYNWLVLAPNPFGSTSLNYYGYFYGAAGGGNSAYAPQLQINATHT